MEPNETLASRPRLLAELAPDLVAVEVPLFEQAQDGQVQHRGPVYRIDIADVHVGRPVDRPARRGPAATGRADPAGRQASLRARPARRD